MSVPNFKHFLRKIPNKLGLINIPKAKKSLLSIQILCKYFMLSKKTILIYFSKAICIFMVNLTILSNFNRRQSELIEHNSSS